MPLIEVENAKITIEFSEKRMIVRNPKQPDETGSILMIDAKANPKRLLSKGPDGKIDPAIYAFEDKGDKLRLCMKENAANDKDFPKSIAPGANVTVFEMVKVKE
jgi:uncharacterized protein (TIGR03067 family)